MARILGSILTLATLSGCAGVSLSNVDDGHSLAYRMAVPAITASIDADCKTTSQIITIPGPARYMSFRSGLGKADTSVEFGPGGTITKFNSKTEGQVEDALKIATAVMGAAARTASEGGGAPKCKPMIATYLIDYDAAGRPTVDPHPFFQQRFDRPGFPGNDE